MACHWTVAKVIELIELLQDRPCLYNTKDKCYHDRTLRRKATKEISDALEGVMCKYYVVAES